ncbi:Deoxyribodipyrimidine photo-lyase [Pseudoruegeria aquimaris]|uniref:Deoxyribodipyrimidine photo-lyase n=1 Tax=Pseudoruegeria aquimaris TaxID=393663 RepID=A0A1Y5RML3_9RHOB|nr:deoxyribodipyrimidine photo-lyase [Pseudoruegeria aquimaris]SLN20981.1 Deoxyribodipyrimidine photo-lyase [Pseudoruegeria aquimaris]
MSETAPVIMWFRRDFRLADNPALAAALKGGGPVICLVIRDARIDALGAAPAFRYEAAVAKFAETLEALGQKLILRSGPSREVLLDLARETGAGAVHWNRLYDGLSREIDEDVKSSLKASGITAESHGGHLLFEPWSVQTGSGGFYRVYSPFWRAVKDLEVAPAIAAPAAIAAPEAFPASEALADWALGAAMNRGAEVLAPHMCVGEEAAAARLDAFIAAKADGYKARRDYPAEPATSGLSENLAYGEIAPHRIWRAGQRAQASGAKGAEHFLKELVWREFAYHLIYHTPHIETESWRPEWASFPWRDDSPQVLAWKQGRTGVPFVDAAMRQLYVSGTMHNRARMIVASYLTKHMGVHWRVGQKWFEECLIDWDPASNAMGWQWVAGSGPDAAPYFRVFNPQTQQEKFDADGAYVRRWLAEASRNPGQEALAFFEAVPRSWGLSPGQPYPAKPVVDLARGRARALEAYEQHKQQQEENVE